eukprot:CAMPEP_0174250900 /NCGR_PEP_ID=MMETSP0439-20130205/915_1 /TAXON_ID=0 /ORGANISM="Stereomyxa ramosa, Strain Chinc5" /LENGTH=222 /DNA_ID=CAMNT_0015331083 /DNA_START=48 /DNA_END=716 /DNA_ORIENTATION=-
MQANYDFTQPSGIGKFNGFLANKSYLGGDGWLPSSVDTETFDEMVKIVGEEGPDKKFVHAKRWFDHIASYSEEERAAWGSCEEAKEAPAKEEAANEEEEDDDDDLDLFGEIDEEELEAQKKERAAKSAKPAKVTKSNVIFDIKPWGLDTDLEAMERDVRAITMDGLVWSVSKLVDIAFGVKKLQITCVIEDEKVSTETLEEAITNLEDYVQSVDIAAFVKVG